MCILGMDPTDPSTIAVTGTGTIQINCGVISNSCSRGNGVGQAAFRIGGTGNSTAVVNATYFGACGDFATSGNPSYSPEEVDDIAPVHDPLYNRREPVPPVIPDHVDLPTINANTVLWPGYYHSTDGTASIQITGGAVAFMPGLYYVEGVKITGGGPIVGSGVTLYNMGASGLAAHTINITGNATGLRFTAPTVAEPGVDNDNVVVWCSSDSVDDDGLRHNFAGNGETEIVGMIYCTNQEVRWGGTHGLYGWGAIFANQVILNGTADMTFNPAPTGVTIPELSTVTLVE